MTDAIKVLIEHAHMSVQMRVLEAMINVVEGLTEYKTQLNTQNK